MTQAISLTDGNYEVADTGEFFFQAGRLSGVILWGFACWWLIVAVCSVASTFQKMPFNIGW
jgi:tellurite resistance protein TehA-like permease